MPSSTTVPFVAGPRAAARRVASGVCEARLKAAAEALARVWPGGLQALGKRDFFYGRRAAKPTADEARRELARALSGGWDARGEGTMPWRIALVDLPDGASLVGVALRRERGDEDAVESLVDALVAIALGAEAEKEVEALRRPALSLGSGAPPEVERGATGSSAASLWAESLRHAPVETGVIPDRARPARLSGLRTSARAAVPAQAIFDAAAAIGVSPEAFVLAAYAALIFRLGRSEDLLIGVESGGPHAAPLRFFLSGKTSFRELARTAEAELSVARARALPPIAELSRLAGQTEDPSRHPVHQASFAFRSRGVPVAGAERIALLSDDGTEDLALLVAPEGDELALVLAGAKDLFETATLARFVRHGAVLFAAAAAEPETPVALLPLLNAVERAHIVSDLNETDCAFPTNLTLPQLLEASAASNPDATALIFGDTLLNYREFNAEANRLARHLRTLGVREGTLVGLCLEKSAELIISVYAILKAGGAYVPLDPTYPPERLGVMLEDAELRFLVATTKTAAKLPLHAARVVDLELEREDIDAHTNADLPASADDATPESLAYMLYTSGSTGRPKGVLVPHATVINFLFSMRKTCDFRDDEVTLSANTVSFDIVIPDLFLSFMVGGTLVVAQKDASLDGAMVSELIQRHRVTNMLATPSTWRILLDAGWEGAPELRIIAAGEALPHALAQVLLGLGKSLWNGYGPTEVTVISNFYQVKDLSRPMYIGPPIDNVFVYVVDEHMEPVPIGVPGEIYIAGAGVTKGYLKRPDLTAERFVANPFSAKWGGRMYRTGDLGRWAPDGNVEYLGRNDDQVKIRGFRIELGDIDAVLLGHPAVDKGVVVVREDQPGDRRLVAYYTLRAGKAIGASELRAHFREKLPQHMVPAHFIAVLNMPLNPNGKIDRKALPKPGQSESAPEALAATYAAPASDVEALLASLWKDLLGVERVGIDEHFFELGGNSLLAVRMVARLKREHGIVIPVLRVFETPTIAGLAKDAKPAGPPVAALSAGVAPGPKPKAPPASGDGRKVAIIGLALRVPGAENARQFWENLAAGVESISFFGEGLDPGVPAALANSPSYVRARGIVDGGECFDHAFFGVSMREAEVMDPQQRLFLECAWATLEDGGYTPDSYGGRIGVYAGTGTNTYYPEIVRPHAALIERVGAFTTMLANEKDYIATRTAFKLNLKGPGVSVQTACSTSLVAIHLAAQALRNGECELAIAGGSSITAPIKSGYLYQEGGMLSPDGHTRSFDDGCQGTVFSDGVAAVLLKRLDRALADGDRIIAVISGSAINNDGGDKASFTAPSIEGQAAVIRAAQRDAGVTPTEVSYVEAHGTATPLGDPIELAALACAFAGQGAVSCAIGSLKSNMGHMVATAGVGGLAKTALMLAHRKLVPSLHFGTPTTKVDMAGAGFRVATRLEDWPETGARRIAGVSSFGVGGTNAHVIVEEAPKASPTSLPRGAGIVLPLSAKSEAALARLCEAHWQNLGAAFTTNGALADLAYTLQVGRKPLSFRMAAFGRTLEELKAALGDPSSARVKKRHAPSRPPELVFLFPGQGIQAPHMGRELYETEPAYREAFDACCAAFATAASFDLKALVLPEPAREAEARAELNRTERAQPAIFAVEYATAKLWMAAGVMPRALIGHSIGEYVAATLAGVFTLADAARLVAERGRLMQSMAPGSLLSVRLSESEVLPLLAEGLSVAAVNSPRLTVVGGPTQAIAALAKRLELQEIPAKVLATSHAFHTAMMDPAVAAMQALAQTVLLTPPRLTIVSTQTGAHLASEQAVDPAYWARQLREPVRFADAVGALEAGEPRVFLECGPRESLTKMTRQCFGRGAHLIVATGDDATSFAGALAELWTAGVAVDWDARRAGETRRRLSLPTYPFERTRCWPNLGAIVMANPKREAQSAKPSSAGRRPRLLAELKALLEEASGVGAADAEDDVTFLELGLDSLFLTQFALKLQRKYSVKITFRQLLEQYASFGTLVDMIDAHLPPEAAPPEAPATPLPTAPAASHAQGAGAAMNGAGGATPQPNYDMPAAVAVNAPYPAFAQAMPMHAPMPMIAGIDAIVAQQLHIMARQLELLSGRPMPMTMTSSMTMPAQAPLTIVKPTVAEAVAAPAPATNPAVTAAQTAAATARAAKEKEVYDAKKAFGAAARITLSQGGNALSAKQRKCYDDFIQRYTTKTRESKRLTQFYRPWLADPRVVTGFKLNTKELVYQIIIERSRGSRMWDVDGNEYVDALCGFGMNYFGWSADFITEAVKEQLDKGIDIGPMTPLAGEVAKLLCEMTGFDRAGFCNTGSEAVMGCMRIARTVTGRDKILTFAGSYHGIFDEVIQRGTKTGKAIPAAPGIMSNTSENVVILEYGTQETLDYIRNNAGDLAAVIAETIQSRRADYQPREFLQEVRRITEKSGTAFVFDEVITGFRLAPGGAQEYFGIKADLASYGKVIGGGFPIGIIAGKREWADALDGGHWKFGDDSKPEVGVTYFAGTFVRHPPALAAARAVLQKLKAMGPGLQKEMNARTEKLAGELNAHFRRVGLPMLAKHMGSLWRCTFTEDMAFGDVMFVWLRSKGLHIWDGFPCFLTTAHSEEDVQFILRVFKETIAEMQAGDLLPGGANDAARGPSLATGIPIASKAAKTSRAPSGEGEPPVPGARLGRDPQGFPAWYVADPANPGKFIKVN